MNYKFLFLIFLLCSYVSCNGGNKNTPDLFIDSMYASAIEEKYYQIFLLNKDIIPSLIDSIETNNKGLIVGFQDPKSSTIHSFMTNYKGIRYAYLIEFILSKDSIESIKGNSWADSIKPYRIYNYGIIVKKNKNNDPILEPLEYDDMVLIKKMYSEWWKKNKEKPLEILRKEWKEKKFILNNDYLWI